MPVYTYKCNSCEHIFDHVQKMSECSLPCNKPCPECDAPEAKRYIGQAPIVAKSGCTNRTHIRKSEDFNSVLKGMKKFYRGSTIETN